MNKTLFFNGVGQFEIKDGEFLIPNDKEYGYECMESVDYESFMKELQSRKHIWYDSWNQECKIEYDNFYKMAEALGNN